MRNIYDSRSVSETAGTGPLMASVRAGPGSSVVKLTGEWDLAVRDQLRDGLAAEVLAGSRNLVVDLSGVTFLDLSCLHALLEGGRLAERADGALQLVSPQPVIVWPMALVGADRLIAVRASRGEAAGPGGAHPLPDHGLPGAPGVVAQ